MIDPNPVDLPIYLAGPIDQTDDPHGWREQAKELVPAGVDVVDPLEQHPEWPDNGAELIQWDLRQAARCNVLVGALGSDPTTGTHYEIERALMNGNRVVVQVDNRDAISRFVLDRPELTFVDMIEEAVELLTDPYRWAESWRGSA